MFTGINNRAYSPWDLRQQRNVRLVHDEKSLRNALTLAYKDPNTLSTIKLAADISLSGPITISSTNTTFAGLIIDGSDQYTLTNTGAMANMFVVSNDCKIQNLKIKGSNLTSIFTVTTDAHFSVDSLDITNSNDGYVFDVTGTHQNTLINDVTIHDDGYLKAVFYGGDTSSNWRASNITLYGCGTILYNTGTNSYHYISIDGITVDASYSAGGTINPLLFGCSFSRLYNVTTLGNTSGSDNIWRDLFVPTSGTITTGARDLIFGAFGYSGSTVGLNSTWISHSAADGYGSAATFTQGITIGQVSANLQYTAAETIAAGNTTTTTATVKTAAIFSTFNNYVYYFEIDVWAHQTNGTNQVNAYKLLATCKNNAGVLTLSPVTVSYIQEEVAAWDATLDTSGTTVRLRVTGAAATNITWGYIARIRRI